MSRSAHLEAVAHLSVAEKVKLVEELWDAIAEETSSLPLSDAQAADIDARLADQAANPGVGESWETLRARLRAK